MFTTRSTREYALRKMLLAGAAFAALAIIQPASSKAQSSDKNNPTPVTTREIVGRAAYDIPKSGWARTFYYVFTAGPGEINVTVMSSSGELSSGEATPGRPSGGWFEERLKRGSRKTGRSAENADDHGVRYNLTFNEYTENQEHGTPRRSARPLLAIGLIAPLETGKREVSKKFILPEPTRLIMKINLSGRFNYRIKFDGPILSAAPHDGTKIETAGCPSGQIRDPQCVNDCNYLDRSAREKCVNQCHCVPR